MKRAFFLVFCIVLISVFQMQGSYTTYIRFDNSSRQVSHSESFSYNNRADYSFSPEVSARRLYRNDSHADKSFNVVSEIPVIQEVKMINTFEAHIQRGEMIPLDNHMKNDFIEWYKDIICQSNTLECGTHKDFLEKHIDAMSHTLNMPFLVKQEHKVTEEIRDFFEQHNYDQRVLDTPFMGTYLQAYVHKQCLSIFTVLAQAQSVHSGCELKPIYSIVADLGWAALAYNINGKVKTASHLVEGCIILLDCTKDIACKSMSLVSAIGGGAWQTAYHLGCGAQQGVDNAVAVFCEPIKFLTGCAQAIRCVAEGMVYATAIGSQFSTATQIAVADPESAVCLIEEIGQQLGPAAWASHVFY